ncbi:MAG: PepSY domain-containing protein [Rivularia sp. T60_A2020_040]|nr:PepSY domain-containing protein [Rivularia sp. T60_A2020_040]
MKKPALTLHRLIGIVVAALMIIIGITGSILVFDKEVNSALHLQANKVTPGQEIITLSQVTEIIQKQYPQDRIQRIMLPMDANDPYHLVIEEKLEKANKNDLYMNPYSGDILNIYVRDNRFIKIVNKLHTKLLAGKLGSFIVGLSGVSLLILSITGTMLWNGWKKLAAGFKVRWSSKWRILNYDLHHVGGFISALLLIIIATTGAFLAFDQPIPKLGYWLSKQEKQVKPISVVQVTTQTLTPDDFLAKAVAALPQGKPTIYEPAKDVESPIKVRFKLPHEITNKGKSMVFIDQYSGEVLQVENFFRNPWEKQFKDWTNILHTAKFGGLGIAGIYILIGIMSAGLAITGIVIWSGKKKKSKPKVKIEKNFEKPADVADKEVGLLE